MATPGRLNLRPAATNSLKGGPYSAPFDYRARWGSLDDQHRPAQPALPATPYAVAAVAAALPARRRPGARLPLGRPGLERRAHRVDEADHPRRRLHPGRQAGLRRPPAVSRAVAE